MRSRRTRLRLLGAGLALYGLVGIVIFIVIAVAVARPLERARQLSESVDLQRAALVDSLGQAETTIRQMSLSVGRMDTSLADAKAAIDRASSISHGVATSMYGLRDAMSLSIFGAQPLIGLSTSFDTSGQNLDQLGDDVANIGTALDANRTDVTTTSQSLGNLADSVHTLTVSVRDGPALTISTRTLDAIRIAVYAVTIWLVVFALGCLIFGAYLLNVSRRPSTTV
jgi:methyl-accepting chemotaxis protein